MKYDKKKALIFSLVKALQVEFFGIFVMLFFMAIRLAMGTFGNLMFGFTGLMCAVCIMADYGMKQGEIARERARLHGDGVKVGFGWVIGVVSMAPAFITTLLLALSKLEIIGNFMPAYKILNAALFPLMDLFAHSADVKDMSPLVLIMTFIFPFLYLFSSYVGFRLSYNRVDVKEKVVYKHDKKED